MRSDQRKHSARLRTLLPRIWTRLGVPQLGGTGFSASLFRRNKPNSGRLRKAAHSQAMPQTDPYANTTGTTEQGKSTQARRAGFNHGLTQSNLPVPPDPLLDSNNTLPETAQSPKQKNLQHRLLLVALLVSSGIGLSALIWLFVAPPSPNCQQVSPLAADSEKLYCADQAVREGELDQLTTALAVVRDWPQDHPLASQANQFADKWSRSLLAIAQEKMDRGQLKQAIAIARQVPRTSSIYSDVQTTIAGWENNWDRGQRIADTAQEALKQQEWKQALDQLQLLTELNNEYWQQQADKLAQQIGTEKQAWVQLQQAQVLAQANTAEQLAEAIRLAAQVNPQSYARAEADAERERWSQALVEIAKENLVAEDFEAVVAAAEKVPLDSAVHVEAQELMQFGQAQLFAQADTLWGYVGAWTLSQQVEPDRSLYEAAKTNITEWERQIQNLGQLKLARWFASLGQVFTYELAIEQAQMIQSDQPRRLQAQTLIAHWRNQIQVLEDYPYIAWASQLAAQDTIHNLKWAIAEARKVDLGRVLRLQAQTLIAEWVSRIQVIEDQPILNRARALANQGQLSSAIEVAERISTGRALYGEAQAAIAQWIAQIQIAEDRPTLDEAIALSEQGNLTQAIEVASQIRPGRALYGEAQSAISRWGAELEALQAPQDSELVPDNSEPSSEDDSLFEDDGLNEEDEEEITPSENSSESESTAGDDLSDDEDGDGEDNQTENRSESRQ